MGAANIGNFFRWSVLETDADRCLIPLPNKRSQCRGLFCRRRIGKLTSCILVILSRHKMEFNLRELRCIAKHIFAALRSALKLSHKVCFFQADIKSFLSINFSLFDKSESLKENNDQQLILISQLILDKLLEQNFNSRLNCRDIQLWKLNIDLKFH